MNYIKTFLIGMTMGACDIVPGVSGGTIAFISGIYQKLLISIRMCFDIHTIRLIFSGNFINARERVNGNFLLSLFGGIVLSILLLSGVLERLIHNYPHMVWGAFGGLIISSILILIKKELVRSISIKQFIFLCVGIALAYGVGLITPTEVVAHWRVVLLSGAIAISAMILPGLSGSYLLLILGMYSNVLGAINDKDIIFLFLFVAGIIIGLASFVRIVSYFLLHHRSTTIITLIGIMIGALPVLRPRQNPDLIITKDTGEEKVVTTQLVYPKNYNKNPHTSRVILLFLLSLSGSFIIFSTIDQDI